MKAEEQTIKAVEYHLVCNGIERAILLSLLELGADPHTTVFTHLKDKVLCRDMHHSLSRCE